MRRRDIGGVLGVVLLAFAFAGVPFAATRPAPAAPALPAVAAAPDPAAGVVAHYVRVETDDAVGAGTVVANETVLTAAHVVELLEDGTWPQIRVAGLRGRVVRYSRGDDLALVLVRGLRVPPAALDPDTAPRVGEDLWYVGSHNNVDGNLDRSVVAKVDGSRVLFNGSVWFGASGGGAYVVRDRRFVLVGVVQQITTSGPKATGVAGPFGAFLERWRDARP